MGVQGLMRQTDQPFSHNLLVFLLHNKLHLGLTSQLSSSFIYRIQIFAFNLQYLEYRGWFEIFSPAGSWMMALLKEKPQCIGNIVCEAINRIIGPHLYCDNYQC